MTSLWIYPENDKKFIEAVLAAYKQIDGWKGTEIFQSNYILEQKPKYPRYLATLDPRGIGGDKCHLWRDGQTWWPMVGDFSFEEETLIETTLKQTIEKFLHPCEFCADREQHGKEDTFREAYCEGCEDKR
jgi:hypothetical protein